MHYQKIASFCSFSSFVFWSISNYNIHIIRPPQNTISEQVKHKFLRFCAFKLNIRIMEKLLKSCREVLCVRHSANLRVMYRISNGNICPELLVQFNVPGRILLSNLFSIYTYSTNYGEISFIERSLDLIDKIFQ